MSDAKLARLEDEAHVFAVDPARLREPAALERFGGWLSPEERARHQRLVRPEAAHRFLVARALVRHTLAAYLGATPKELRFQASAGGRPELAAAPSALAGLRFNLSHTRGLVVLVVARDALSGIDVERLDRPLHEDGLRLARRYFDAAEQRALAGLQGEARRRHFLMLWTLKEAHLKARSRGLAGAMARFAFEPEGECEGDGSDGVHRARGVDTGSGAPLAGWQLECRRLGPAHLGSLALRTEEGGPRRFVELDPGLPS